MSMGDEQLDLYADVPALAAVDGRLPVIIRAWEMREADHAPIIVLVAPSTYEVDPHAARDGKTAGKIAGEFKIATPRDTRQFYPVDIACPAGWTVEPGPAGGVGIFVDATGALTATAVAIRDGMVKVVKISPLPDRTRR